MCLRSRPRPARSLSLRLGALVLLALSALPAAAQDPLLWGGLKPGPHAVGYRSLYRLDHTRQYDPEFVTDPARAPAHKPRPISIAVWYPARKTWATGLSFISRLAAWMDERFLVSQNTTMKRPDSRRDWRIC